ncbi:hypothetical protein K439DRAFT_1231753, partial [Ramaria rubella]
MLKLLDHHPDMYLDEIALELMDKLRILVAISTVHYSLKLLGITTKKCLSKMALERCEAHCMAFLFEISNEPATHLVFTHESAVNTLTSYRSMGHGP